MAAIVPVIPDTYAMPNGDSGTFNYWDDLYPGVPGATPLSGSTGDLTDGVAATENWNVVESGTGPYVGWTSDPTITFDFGGVVDIDMVTVYVDDSNTGGVAPPASIDIATIGSFPVSDPAGSAPFAIEIPVSFSGSIMEMTIVRGNDFVMVSEVEFGVEEDPGIPDVPEPTTSLVWGVLGLSLGFTGWRRRKA